jgi:serine/threonine protein kinase
MRNGDIRHRYKVFPHIIGQGAFGTVRSCLSRKTNGKTKEKLAVKSILKRGNVKNAKLLKNEIALVQHINHRNIVRVVDVIQDKEYIHIVMEECKGGDLFDRIVDGGVKLSEKRAAEIIGSLLDAICYLHERDIVHRDLKVSIVLLSTC